MSTATCIIICITIFTLPDPAPANQNDPTAESAENKAHEFVAAAKRGDEHAVRKALEKDADLAQATDYMGMTALDWAATREYWPIFRQLLAKGAPATEVGFDGGTVAHRVCHHDRADMLQLLLDAGADITVQNQWGRTPLHVAARRGCLETASLLLENGADPNVGTKEGWTCLHVAYLAGQPEAVELLLTRGADPRAKDVDGKLPAELEFTRPRAISIDKQKLFEYQGLFDVHEHFHFKVWVEGERLMLRDFGSDALYPTGPDAFYCESEPWSVAFLRNENGEIDEIEVHFLRRAVRGSKRDHPQYVGAQQCRQCHLGEEHGNQYVTWLSSRHAAAYWHLATEWALFLAHIRPHFQDVNNPREDRRCLNCHITAAQDPDALFAPSFDMTQGVGCESCHGPGSEYLDADVMSDREKFIAAGGIVPGEQTCRNCHRNPERFDFAEWWPEIDHTGGAQAEMH